MIKLKLNKKGNGELFLSRNRKIVINGYTFLNEFKYNWSWNRFKFDFWLHKSGYIPRWKTLTRITKKEYGIILERGGKCQD